MYKKTNPSYNVTIEILIPLLITFLGTFLGFILAIIGELNINKSKNRKETQQIINILKKEIYVNKDKLYDREALYPEFYQLYSFNGICNSGKLYMILNQPWYLDLIDLYNDYREVNYCFQLSIKQLQLGESDEKIIASQAMTIPELRTKAEALLNKIKSNHWS